jgi:predicted permease
MNWIRHFFARGQLYSDLSLEIQGHLEEKIAELVENGMPRAEAESFARREFGNVTLIQESGREVWQWHALENLLQDGRHSLRLMRRSPGFTIVAVLSLALGIGANTSLFSLLDSLVLRDLPVPHPEQLVRVGAHTRGDSFAGLSLPMFNEIARDQKVFSTMFAWSGDAVLNVEANGALSRADLWAAAGNFYSELGAVPEIGRLIGPDEVNLNSAVPAQVAVLGYGFWQRHYGGARDVIGRTIRIEGLPFTVIGVTRKGFTGIANGVPPEVTVPITAWPVVLGDSNVQQYLRRPDSRWLETAGRLKAGTTLEQARAQLESIWPPIRQALAPTAETPLEVSHFLSLDLKIESGAKGGSFLRGRFIKPLYVLLVIAGLVLLVACVNLASLMLARAASRSHEIGVRVALGASRGRLTRQMLTESVTLSIAGALGAFAFAGWGSHALSSFILGQMFIVPAELNLSPDWRILSFTAGMAILTSILFGWAPAWRAAGEYPNRAVQQNTRTLARNTGRLGKALIVMQVALSLVLLVSAGLFIRSLQKLRAANPGFRTHGLLQVSLTPKPGGYKNLAWVNYYRELNGRVSNLPGVLSAAFIDVSPGNVIEWTESIRLGGTSAEPIQADVEMVMPGAFRTLGIKLLHGRDFTWQDDDHAPRVAIMSENFAAQFFPNSNAIGQRLDITTEPKWQNLQIVGIVSNASLYDIRKHEPPTVYLPTAQYGDYMGYPYLLIETRVSPAGLAGPIRQTVESFGHEYVSQIKPIEQSIDRSLLQERVTAMLSAFFGALALLLSAIGLYGLVAYNVTRRSREIGIRMALGAQRELVQWMVLRETLLLAFTGLIIGLPCAIAASRLIAGMLYGVGTSDPVTLICVSLLLIAVSALAGFIPARRAMRLDPIATLHNE